MGPHSKLGMGHAAPMGKDEPGLETGRILVGQLTTSYRYHFQVIDVIPGRDKTFPYAGWVFPSNEHGTPEQQAHAEKLVPLLEKRFGRPFSAAPWEWAPGQLTNNRN